MNYTFQNILKLSLYLILGIFISSCANIVPPAGGPMDKEAPKILSIKPSDSSLNKKIKKIEIIFDKYMVLGDLANNLYISPSIAVNPTVDVRLKKVIINIQDSLLLDNTTYTLSLGDALKDNREGTPYANFNYIFSTGSYFDSLSIKGSALNAESMQVDTGLIAMLYDDNNFSDSTLLKQKPMYRVKVDASGNFEFHKLPNRPFRLFVLKDNNKDNIYLQGWDEIGFMESTVMPTFNPDTIYKIKHFLEEVDSTTLAQLQEANASTASSSPRSKPKMTGNIATLGKEEMYKVLVDTFTKNKGTQAINEPLKILIAKGVQKIDKDKIFLSFKKEEVDIESLSDIQITDSQIVLKTEWQDHSQYTLRLVKGWATDSAGKELVPGKYLFQSMGKDQYGTLRLQIPQEYINNHYVLQLISEGEEKKLIPINDSIYTFTMMNPGVYQIRIIEDLDKNGKWTSGDYFLKRQAENIITHNEAINLKAAWDLEIVFKPGVISNKKRVSDRGQATKTSNQDD